ncbi:hypothetical protein CONCODRAFT_9889 [Conidiobolus coronatus NRRL 28638]|uniref:Uncharacterized protein n=1 Tax=Conidiobolus coronatus (strain ATCC 28846 / CBS 209.66 / NRRL 28638) TaxID=796925 RepID=A0A137NYM9_CONC2|nr:hypothetical protein CONCODRAFT_9889 [Conidiobolus coronatus NRRL 28638]|eukprot:KXN67953.1 hypothetical protein CONCODRAFT_9889 [Conidiobolus coronatus NRRL 28638]
MKFTLLALVFTSLTTSSPAMPAEGDSTSTFDAANAPPIFTPGVYSGEYPTYKEFIEAYYGYKDLSDEEVSAAIIDDFLLSLKERWLL